MWPVFAAYYYTDMSVCCFFLFFYWHEAHCVCFCLFVVLFCGRREGHAIIRMFPALMFWACKMFRKENVIDDGFYHQPEVSFSLGLLIAARCVDIAWRNCASRDTCATFDRKDSAVAVMRSMLTVILFIPAIQSSKQFPQRQILHTIGLSPVTTVISIATWCKAQF